MREQCGCPSCAQELLEACDWPKMYSFKFVDMPGEHDPCYVCMPDGAMLALNHDDRPGVDVARAKFIVDACNAARSGIRKTLFEKLNAIGRCSERMQRAAALDAPPSIYIVELDLLDDRIRDMIDALDKLRVPSPLYSVREPS